MRLGAEVPFATAADLLRVMTGTHLSASTIRRLTIASGRAMRQLELEFVAAVEAGMAPTPPIASGPLQLSVDGSMVPMVHGEWREARLLAIGVLPMDGGESTATSFTAPSYYAALESAETFTREAVGEVVRRGLDQAPRVVAVSDGAPWIQSFIDLHCPQAVRILDFAHAAGYLAQAATEAFGLETAQAQAWFGTQRHTLRHGDPDAVLAAVAVLPPGEARTTALRYLGERRAMIAYRAFAAAGWPIGSGCVESAHKHVVQDRLKGSGMHWTPEVVTPMLALRTTLANARWEDAFPRLGPWRRQCQRHRRATQHQTAAACGHVATRTPDTAPPLPTTPLPVPLRPAATSPPQRRQPAPTHPWRRSLLRPSLRPVTKT